MCKAAVVVVACVAFLSTGCTINVGGGEDAESQGETTGSQKHSYPEGADIEAFLKSLHEEYPATQTVDDKDLISLGLKACDGFRSGDDQATVIDDVAGQGADESLRNMAAYVAGAAQAGLCPDTLG